MQRKSCRNPLIYLRDGWVFPGFEILGGGGICLGLARMKNGAPVPGLLYFFILGFVGFYSLFLPLTLLLLLFLPLSFNGSIEGGEWRRAVCSEGGLYVGKGIRPFYHSLTQCRTTCGVLSQRAVIGPHASRHI